MEETKKKNTAGGKGNKPQAPPKENRGDNKNQGKQSESAHASGASSPVNNSGSTRSVPYSKKASRSHLVLFDHLPHKGISKNNDHISQDPLLHPMTCKLRTFYQNGVIREDDDRVVALIGAFSKIIQSYTTPPNSNLSWDLDKVIKLQVKHIDDGRQPCMGMSNLVKSLRYEISRIPPEMHESDAKNVLLLYLRQFLEDKIMVAREDILKVCLSAIRDDDVVLTFGSSPLLRYILEEASLVRRFRLIVADTRPLHEGLSTLKTMSSRVSCVYTSLSGVTSIISQVSKVLLGASALLANGAMLAPAGTAMVASIARSRRLPVIVACESYKFCDKVQVDSIVHNELGSEIEIAAPSSASSTSHSTASGSGSSKSSNNSNSHNNSSTNNNNNNNNNNNSGTSVAASPIIDGKYRGGALRWDRHDDHNPSSSTSSCPGSLPFQVINLRYDLTPIGNISAIATETGLIPPTSIPVLLREVGCRESDPDAVANEA